MVHEVMFQVVLGRGFPPPPPLSDVFPLERRSGTFKFQYHPPPPPNFSTRIYATVIFSEKYERFPLPVCIRPV